MAAVRNRNQYEQEKRSKVPWALLGAIVFGGAAALFLYAVVFAPKDGMMSSLLGTLKGLCGGLYVLSPLVFVYLCALCACRVAGKRVVVWRVIANLLLVLCLFSAVELFFCGKVEAANGGVILSWADFLAKAFRYRGGGGALGGMLARPLYNLLGAWGGLIGVLVIVTLLLAVTGKLSRMAKLVRQGSHNAEQRRMEKRSERMFETDSMLDDAFGERPRQKQRVPTPKQRRLYKEDIDPNAGNGGRATTSRRDSRVSTDRFEPSASAGGARRRTVNPEDVAATPQSDEAPWTEQKAQPTQDVWTQKRAERKAREEAAVAAETPAAAETTAAQEERTGSARKADYVPGTKARPSRAGAEKTSRKDEAKSPAKEEVKEEESAKTAEDLRIIPDEYEPKEAEAEAEEFRPEPERPKLKRSASVEEGDEEPYNYPPIDLLVPPPRQAAVADSDADMQKARQLEETLKSFGISTKLTGIAHGPAVTRFELQPAPGVKVSRITSLADDIALRLSAMSIRIEAPIPGKAAVGVEVPNDKIETVSLRAVLESADARKHASRVAVGLGKDNSGRYIIADIAKMPHVLIAGQTGSGKSVCINSIIVSILYRATPDEVKLILIDPKVVELSVYNGIPHLVAPVVTDPKKAASALDWAVAEMTRRYKAFADRGVRDIKGYNKELPEGEKPMPHMVIIIDELADLMMAAPGEVEDSICRLAQLARAAGMHLVIATQRPSVNVITGVIKANIPSRVAFLVASQVDSRTIIDHGGAEKLLGHGDMLYVPAGIQKPMRVQGSWVSDEEVHAIVEYIKELHEPDYDEDMVEKINNALMPDAEKEEKESDECDDRLPEAIEIVLEAGQASVSMLQRRMRVGYARAGRLIDEMYLRGIVSEADGAKPRTVLITREEFERMFEDE